MATKKCANGHLYDSSIYGDNCPFCPSASGATTVNPGFSPDNGTKVLDGDGPTKPVDSTIGIFDQDDGGGGSTVIRHVGPSVTGETNVGQNRRLVGLLVSYDQTSTGEVYKIYEGRNIIGRRATCDIVLSKDANVSGSHLLILYVEAEGIYWAEDQKSSNGTYINGKFVREHQLDTNDVIVIGATKFMFFAIPKF